MTVERIYPSNSKHNRFMLAVRHGNLKIATQLLPKVNLGINNKYAIFAAVKNNDDAMVRLLLADPGMDVVTQENFIFFIAAQIQFLEMVKLSLADPRVDPALLDNYALRRAAREGRREMVKLLLAHPKVNPAAQNNAAFRAAAQNGHLEVVKLLLADPRVNPTANHNEAFYSSNDKVQKLLLRSRKVIEALRSEKNMLAVNLSCGLLMFPLAQESILVTKELKRFYVDLNTVPLFKELTTSLQVLTKELEASYRTVQNENQREQIRIYVQKTVELLDATLKTSKSSSSNKIELMISYLNLSKTAAGYPSVTMRSLGKSMYVFAVLLLASLMFNVLIQSVIIATLLLNTALLILSTLFFKIGQVLQSPGGLSKSMSDLADAIPMNTDLSGMQHFLQEPISLK